MNDNKVIQRFVDKILSSNIFLSTMTYGNISLMADDHPRYNIIQTAYAIRRKNENNKK